MKSMAKPQAHPREPSILLTLFGILLLLASCGVIFATLARWAVGG